MEMGATVVFLEGDKRSLCDNLRGLKQRIWRQPEFVQIDETKKALVDAGRMGYMEEALASWHPLALFAVCTNVEGQRVEKLLLEEHRRRYPDHPIPMRFSPGRKERKEYRRTDKVGVPGYLAEGGGVVDAVVGTRVWVSFDAAMHYMKTEPGRLWVYDGWRTIHCLQGHTISCADDTYDEDHSLFILSDSLGSSWNRNATYTAVSRVRHLRQLYWVQQGPLRKPPRVRVASATERKNALVLLDDVYG
jgi:hypothetical protein